MKVRSILPRDFVQEYGIRSLVCCFSGGKDSLVATHYVFSQVEDLDIDRYAVMVDTTVMIPMALDFARDISKRLGWSLVILKPKKTFWEQAEIKGMPHIHRRWCCYGLKLQPIFDFVRKLKPQRAEVLGLRKDESPRRQKMNLPCVHYDRRRQVNSWFYVPIWNWTEKHVLNYMKDNNLPMPPHYKLGFKETCLCGAFTNLKEIMVLKATYPDLFEKFVQLERKFVHERTDKRPWACFYDDKPIYARDLKKQQVLIEGFPSKG